MALMIKTVMKAAQHILGEHMCTKMYGRTLLYLQYLLVQKNEN